MLDWFSQPWPWYVVGPLIGLTVPALLILGNKPFGISSTMRHICAACVPARIPFFQYNWKKEVWNLFFAGGIVLGGFLAAQFFGHTEPVAVHHDLVHEMAGYGITNLEAIVPAEMVNWSQLISWQTLLFVVFGGFLIGFGTRYAGGCTSGHAIMGLSNLQWPSLVATCCFMVGGILMANFVLPFILNF